MSRLRSYTRMSPRSEKVKDGEGAFKAVYAEVDARSGGRCEVEHVDNGEARCRRRAAEHHHLFRPRRSHHTAEVVVHICRACHERTEYPFIRGRLCFLSRRGTAFLFAIRYANDKWEARRS